MDLADHLKILNERATKLSGQLQTEEAAKQALILPFLQALGYDIFNPAEILPEFTTDIGTKKGERIDYAIMANGKPVVLIECKACNDKLERNTIGQLLRYFHVSEAKFGILTNGLDYKFYTDLEQPNKMDEKPFMAINIMNIKEQDIVELKKFHKSVFNADTIFSTASELKYLNELKLILAKETEAPSDGFTKYFIGEVYSGRATANVIEQFKGIVKKALNQFTSEIVSNRIKSVLDKEKEAEVQEANKEVEEEKIIETTGDEMESFYIIKGIIRQKIDSHRIFFRDAQRYFTIIIDDNNKKLICRLYLNGVKKYIGILDDKKNETKSELTSIDDIYKFSEQLLKIAEAYN
ncbi:MAG: type I restriction enzyme HsdR N-terminal domain-containing protein [Bacteroidales bacterium]|nr:type I restriction enzyme HsdR N-terminal domain-containing protein [Bacteroidales bacterium]